MEDPLARHPVHDEQSCPQWVERREKKREKTSVSEETDVNKVSIRSTPNPMPTGQRYGSIDLLLPFGSRHYKWVDDTGHNIIWNAHDISYHFCLPTTTIYSATPPSP